MKKHTLISGTIVLTILAVTLAVSTTSVRLSGSLLGSGDLPTRVKSFADTDQNGALTARELRTALIAIIRGVALSDAAFDVNQDSTVSRADTRDTITAMRALLLAVCGNGTLDAGEQCDDGNANAGDGCSDICLPEPSTLSAWAAGIQNLALPPLPISNSENDGPHGAEPMAVALHDEEDRAIVVWSESDFSAQPIQTPNTALSTSIFAAVYTASGLEKTELLPPTVLHTFQQQAGYCRACHIPVAVAGPNGTAHVFFETPIFDTEGIRQGYQLYQVMYDGTVFTTPVALSGVTPWITKPSVAFNASGNGIIVWHQYANPGVDMYVSRYAEGSGWSSPEFVTAVENSSWFHDEQGPLVGLDDAGHATVVYRVSRTPPPQSDPLADFETRIDLDAITSPGTGVWSEPVVVVQNTDGWHGYSPSNTRGKDYQRSVVEYQFIVQGDGHGMLAYTQQGPTTAGTSLSPVYRVFARSYDAGTWSSPYALSGEADDTNSTLKLAGDPVTDDYMVLWKKSVYPVEKTQASLFQDGTWTGVSDGLIYLQSRPVFLMYSARHDTFIAGLTRTTINNIQADLVLAEMSRETQEWSPQYPGNTFSVTYRDIQKGSIVEGNDALFILWSQERKTGYQNTPDPYYMYQHVIRGSRLLY